MGLAVGISSGANFIGALKGQESLSDETVVATVFPDDSKKYLSTDLLKEEAARAGYLAPGVQLEEYEAFGRVCRTCLDLDENS